MEEEEKCGSDAADAASPLVPQVGEMEVEQAAATEAAAASADEPAEEALHVELAEGDGASGATGILVAEGSPVRADVEAQADM